VLFMTGVLLCLTPSGWSQSKPPTPTLTSARQKYLGAKVTIKGPLESSPGLLALYINWRVAKQDTHGRYHAVSPVYSARLPYGYERHQSTIIAVQLSDDQPKGPWIDVLGNRHEANEIGPNFDFLVRFDDGVIGVCTSSLESPGGNFDVVTPKPNPQK
jgi:hypothetical protein